MAGEKNKAEKILVFGNPYLKEDNLAVKIAGKLKLKGFEMVYCSNPDELLAHKMDEVLILDVAQGLKKVTLFNDIDRLESSKMFSLHDFDPGFFLKLLKETGKLKKARMIGIPQGYDERKAVEDVKRLINSERKK